MELDFKLVGQRIRQARKASGLTTAELAAQVGLTKESLRHIETAAGKPRLQTFFQIADILDVSLDCLTGRNASLVEEVTQSRRSTAKQEHSIKDVVNSIVSLLDQPG